MKLKTKLSKEDTHSGGNICSIWYPHLIAFLSFKCPWNLGEMYIDD